MNEGSANASSEAVPPTLYERQVLLAFMPPSQRQQRMALACVLVMAVLFIVTAPFIAIQLPQISAFIPVVETAVFICALITASLLFVQYAVSGALELLSLASGYLFTALIVVPHALTFPEAFAPTGLLGAESQTTAWLYIIWHCGFALFVIGYALLKRADGEKTFEYPGSPGAAIGSITAILIALVGGLTWVIITQDRHLPRIIGPDESSVARYTVRILMCVFGALALALLWRRRRSVLDLWLIVVMFAFLFEAGRFAFDTSGRYSLGFYAVRIYALTTAVTVLLVLLSETTMIYATPQSRGSGAHAKRGRLLWMRWRLQSLTRSTNHWEPSR